MTANQINYAKLQEDVRHNIEQEAYNRRMASVAEFNANTNVTNATANLTGAYAAVAQANEAARHNWVSERQGWWHVGTGVLDGIGRAIGNVGRLLIT